MRPTLALIALFLVLFSCKKAEKDVYNYYPKVKTLSAKVQSDGSVLVTGKLLSEGAGELWGVGFCMDTLPHPEMHFRQKICDTLWDGEFHAVYTSLDALKKYYFRSWAVNENGYTYGEDIPLESISIDSASIPCQVAMNTIKISGFIPEEEAFISVGPVEHGVEWEVWAYSNSHSVHFSFLQQPTTGKYKITTGTGAGYYVNVLVDGYSLTSGDIYVEQINSTTHQFTICNAIFPGGFMLTAKLRSPM